jgi:serine/threonine protein phosphatase PrpC
VIAEPEIKFFKIDDKVDFLLLACDGVFDKLDSTEAISVCWQNIFGAIPEQDTKEKTNKQLSPKDRDAHRSCGLAVDGLIKASAARKSCDNLTAVAIAFDGFDVSLKSIRDPDQTFS